MPWISIYFCQKIPIYEELKPHFTAIFKEGTNLVVENIKIKKRNDEIKKEMKKIFHNNIELQTSLGFQKLCGLISFLPEKNCFILYQIIFDINLSFIRFEFSRFGNNEEINSIKTKLILKALINDLELLLKINY